MTKTVHCYILSIIILFFAVQVHAQSYHALTGSPYAGVTAMYNNPASTVNQAYKWDVTLFGLQSTISNTAFIIENNSLTNTANSNLLLTNGLRPRYFHANIDIDVLNARYSINSKNAVAIGLRLRTYNHAKGTPLNYADTFNTIQKFFRGNDAVSGMGAFGTHTGWAEFNVNYARTILQTQTSLLSAGVTVSYMKGLSGAYTNFSNISYLEAKKNGKTYFVFTQAALAAAYSDNYMESAGDNTPSQNVQNFLSKSLVSWGFDIGAEYLFKNVDEVDNTDVNKTNYDWKIGASIMDIGRNKFNPIDGSFAASNPTLSLTDTSVQHKLDNVKNIKEASDTLSALFTTFNAVKNRFTISLPTRLIISVDHNLGSHFFVNGELSINFYSSQPAGSLHTREINLLTITPRWETPAWGLYLPVQYNAQGQLWVGAAVKLGPLILGVHSLDVFNWFKTGTQTYNGGGYLLLSIHPFGHPKPAKGDVDCPDL